MYYHRWNARCWKLGGLPTISHGNPCPAMRARTPKSFFSTQESYYCYRRTWGILVQRKLKSRTGSVPRTKRKTPPCEQSAPQALAADRNRKLSCTGTGCRSGLLHRILPVLEFLPSLYELASSQMQERRCRPRAFCGPGDYAAAVLCARAPARRGAARERLTAGVGVGIEPPNAGNTLTRSHTPRDYYFFKKNDARHTFSAADRGAGACDCHSSKKNFDHSEKITTI